MHTCMHAHCRRPRHAFRPFLCSCAVIVNDMAELNIDAGLVKQGGLIQVRRSPAMGCARSPAPGDSLVLGWCWADEAGRLDPGVHSVWGSRAGRVAGVVLVPTYAAAIDGSHSLPPLPGACSRPPARPRVGPPFASEQLHMHPLNTFLHSER